MLFCIVFASCENFLKGADVKNQLDDAIEIANSNPITYYVIADKDSGAVSPTQFSLKKKQTASILFTPADGWNFICWEVLDRTTNEPVPDAIKFEGPQKLETKITILKPAENLKIHPKCQLVPKVIEITPKFDNTGCDQDRTIEIIFNKPVNPQTLDFESISITTPEGAELFSTDPTKSFFKTPYFSSENKVLNIPTIKGKFLLLPDGADKATTPHNSEKATDDITVRIDCTNVKDVDGLSIEQIEPHSYRVNKNVDNVPPVITEIHLFSTSDENDYFRKELTNKPFFEEDGITLNWSSEIEQNEDGTTKFQNGDYSQNHVSHLYITLKGYDERSGLKGIKIRETYKKDTSGVSVERETNESDLYTSANGEYKINYNFFSNNPNDGLFLIEVILIDKAGQENAKQYWVIKDTYNSLVKNKVSIMTYSAEEEDAKNINMYVPAYNPNTHEYETGFPFNNFSITQDKFFDNLYSQRLFTLSFHEDKDESVVLIDKEDIGNTKNVLGIVNAALATRKRNPDKTSFFEITIVEESGVSGKYEFAIPKATFISEIDGNNVVISDTTSVESLPNLDLRSISYSIFYTYQAASSDPPSALKFLASSGNFFSYKPGGSNPIAPKEKGIYNFYISIRAYPINSALGKSYTYYYNDADPNPNINPDFSFPDFTLPDHQKNEIVYEAGSGTAKFNIGVSFPKNNYIYSLVTKKREGGSNAYRASPDGKDMELESGYTYDVYITAKDLNGNLVGKSSHKTLELNKVDNIPPAITSGGNRNHHYIDSENYRYYEIPYDYGATRNTIMVNSFECYFVPESYGKTLSLTELNSGLFRHKTIVISEQDRTNRFINIPYDGLDFGKYWIYFYLKDNSTMQNEIVFANSQWMDCTIEDNTPSVLVYKNEGAYKLKVMTKTPKNKPYGNSDYNFHVINLKKLNGNFWEEPVKNTAMERNEVNNTGSYVLEYNNYSDKFVKISTRYTTGLSNVGDACPSTYCMPLYIYTDYYKYLYDYETEHPGQTAPAYCVNKTWMPMANGWQIFNDRPCFVHTRYCSKNLTEPGDLSIEAANEWEARGQETGILYNDGTGITFSYTDDNLAAVPKGAYYTTICHFADGSVLMSEVKQK